ncbi:XRE family transcriptional regulator [Salmonella enterica subsp. enterica serovar Kottbus]|uniref:XRE family transcriptional regulator n=1 Tax=Salmonella enterica subsp. enterica serovar Kottbus TaxID=224727 RepID=A0A5U6M8V6_SALET|nr:XRE family transcriptional regulator [Salmonella enterica subsp. enterica serovar Kottbus]EBY5039813.1 XRE family transcriptional regulator [Salmonella enterica subsp. enterica serovar Kottbus]EBY6713950.1 XRE family transcriptional regulator [Salmonella enterica subsp. enterica serovar Kottbus]EBZ6410082.1 XRE family transcriptional regulator [Salmonella enterica subsp. enterica serovar Kottbus]ECA2703455.1 XRE family transcriptional regulator [Salmonella enterica subsp. enterica serovar Ko
MFFMSQDFFNGEFMSFDSDFPKRIAQARTTVGLTQAALASLAGVVQRQIAAYEGGEAKPREKTLVRLASALGTSVEWLTTGNGEAPDLSQYIPTASLRQIPLITPEMIPSWVADGKLKTHKFHPCNAEVSERAFAVEIIGDSMAKSTNDGISFPPGSIVTFDPAEKVFNKDFVIALLENGMTTFKQVFMDMVSVSLSAIDIRYPMIHLQKEKIDNGSVTLIPAVYLEVPLYKITSR